MKTVEEVLRKYTLGEAGKDETNDNLKELGSPLCLNPDRNVITPEELAETRVGVTPDEANGYADGTRRGQPGKSPCGGRPHGGRGHGPGDRLCLYGRKAIPPAGRCADGGGLRWSC